jgi:hypothetical protein
MPSITEGVIKCGSGIGDESKHGSPRLMPHLGIRVDNKKVII